MSTIEWTEQTWNPTVGCRRISAGCDACYAIKVAHRFAGQFAHYAGTTELRGGRVDWTGAYNVAPDHIFDKPLRVTKPTVWFVNSMSDLFGEGVSDGTIKRAFKVMNDCPHHQFQVLTKRPNRAVKMVDELDWTPNIWFGVSIELDKYVGRADLLRKIPAAVRFLSLEPLLGPLPNLDLSDIDWAIVGGESGPKSRPLKIEWARDLRDRCMASKVAFFFKQWGNWDEHGVRHHGKKDAGRELDGRTWDEMPAPRDRRERGSRWLSVEDFRADLANEHLREEAPPRHNDNSPRIALREPIWRTLRERGDMDAKTLRETVLSSEGLSADSARIVNFHAWALVDLLESEFVVVYVTTIEGKRGRTKKVKMYRASKPRVRVLAKAA